MHRMPGNAPRLIPALVAAQGLPLLAAFWVGGRPEVGAVWAAVAVAAALVLVVGGRSETIRVIRGELDDERIVALEYRATTVAAVALVAALFALMIVDGLRGETGLTYALLLVLMEATHLTALVVLTRRS